MNSLTETALHKVGGPHIVQDYFDFERLVSSIFVLLEYFEICFQGLGILCARSKRGGGQVLVGPRGESQC